MLTEIRFAGFGGQGILLAANLIGKAAAIHEGGYATMTQNYGPEARGGASSAQLVISDEPILYPYVTREDILVALSQEAYARFSPNIKPNGMLIVEEDLVRVSEVPPGVSVFGLPATRIAEELGKKVVLNLVMVGFFAALSRLFKEESYRKAITESVPKALLDLNLKAFDAGFARGMEVSVTQNGEDLNAAESVWLNP